MRRPSGWRTQSPDRRHTMQVPRLTLEDDTWWTATAKFPTCAGFQARAGADGAGGAKLPSGGTVKVCVAPEGRGHEPLAAGELALIAWYFEHEAEVLHAVQTALLDAYPGFRDQYRADADDGSELPEVNTVDELKRQVGLRTLKIHQVSRDGVSHAHAALKGQLLAGPTARRRHRSFRSETQATA